VGAIERGIKKMKNDDVVSSSLGISQILSKGGQKHLVASDPIFNADCIGFYVLSDAILTYDVVTSDINNSDQSITNVAPFLAGMAVGLPCKNIQLTQGEVILCLA